MGAAIPVKSRSGAADLRKRACASNDADQARRLLALAAVLDVLEADAALAEVRVWAYEAGLTLHPTKTHVGDCRVPGQGFEFLGYRFEAGRRLVRKKRLTKIKDSIRDKTPRTRGVSLERVIGDLNPVLRGWFGYFKQAHQTTFDDLDGFIRRRLGCLPQTWQCRAA